jgi:CheY-like chemotaxis protein
MKKIVIVEDNQTFIKFVQREITREFPECKTYVYANANEAVESIGSDNNDFDILLLDGDLGRGGSGETVLAALTTQQKNRTIVCSADEEFTAKAKAVGVVVFLDKGFRGIYVFQIPEYIITTLKRIQN